MTIDFLLYVIAFCCFLFAAAGVSSKVNLEALGLALLTLSLLI